MEKQLKINPYLVLYPLKDGYVLAVNHAMEKGIKILNNRQTAFLDLLKNKHTISGLISVSGYPEDVVRKLLDIFKETEMIGIPGSFSSPDLPGKPGKIDFWMHTTEACTLKCPYCYIDKTNAGNISTDVLQRFSDKILEAVKKYRLKEVSLRLSGGEPMLRFKQMKEFIPAFKAGIEAEDCQTNIGFLTNLTLLNDEILEFVLKENLFTSISLDGCGKYHDATRYFHDHQGSFSIVDKNINRLIEAGHSRMILMTVVSDRNMEGLPDFAHYLVEKNLPFRFSLVAGEKIDLNKLKAKLLQVYDIFEKYILEKNYRFTRNHRLDDLRFLKPSHFPCSAGFASGGLFIDGNIYFCQQELGHGKVSGSVFDQENLFEIIQKKRKWHTPLPDDCQNCPYRYVCSGGCPLIRKNGKSPYCDLYKELLPVIFRLIGLERLQRVKKAVKTKSTFS